MQSVHESRKNGVNCIRNMLIRAIGRQSVRELETLNRSKPAIA